MLAKTRAMAVLGAIRGNVGKMLFKIKISNFQPIAANKPIKKTAKQIISDKKTKKTDNLFFGL